MNVRQIMTHHPLTVVPKATIDEALVIMAEGGFHHLPVVSTQKHVVGLVTQRDCRVALRLPELKDHNWQKLPESSQVLVNDIMSPAPITTSPSASVTEAARLMYEYNLSCLPVMLEETLVGIITQSDVLLALIHRAERDAMRSNPQY